MPSGGARPGAGRKKKDGSNGGRKHFSAQEIEIMLDSPYVAYVSRTTISFTIAFKEMFWQRYCDGITPVKIFEDAGLDVSVIGKGRIDTLVKALRDQTVRGLPFKDGLERHINKPEKQFDLPKQPRFSSAAQIPLTPEAIAKMVQKVAYLEQQMEFLKKIIMAGTVKK